MGGPRGAVAGRDLLTRIPNRGFGACVSSLSVRFAGHELRSEQEVAVCSRRLGVLPAARKGTDGAASADQRSSRRSLRDRGVEFVEKTLVAEGGGTMGMATVTRIGTQTDQDIQRDVLNELRWEPRVQPNEIGVGGKDGRGAATGRVRTVTQQTAADEGGRRAPRRA